MPILSSRRAPLALLLLTFGAAFIFLSRSSFSITSYLNPSLPDDTSANMGRVRIEELHGLLNLVARSKGTLPTDGSIDGRTEVSFNVYAAAAGTDDDFAKHAMTLRREKPVVVFSKSFCPYSKRAKQLINEYKLSPAPVIVELDHREDQQIIQNILQRLTGRRTVPNVIVHTTSLGGSDDVQALHNENKLTQIFEENGVKVSRKT